MVILYQGVPGAYSSIAAAIFRDNINKDIVDNKKDDDLISGLTPCATFAHVRSLLDDNSLAILPIENSYAGTIHENIYAFLTYPFQIRGEITLPINHCLLSYEKDITKIERVYSHPQALAQCAQFLIKHDIDPIAYEDTAKAVQMIADTGETGVAAIASRQAGLLYGLQSLATNIQDQDGNTTRFFIIAKNDVKHTLPRKTKTAILFAGVDKPGSLYLCLAAFAHNNINLTKIESLPNLKERFTYYFYVECLGIGDVLIPALTQLRLHTTEVRILGEY